VGAAIGILALAVACGDVEPSRRAARDVPAPKAVQAPTARGGAAVPVLDYVGIEPSRPGPSSRVTASVQARDADGDAVRLHYVWKLNGTVISDKDTAVLAGASKGDRIELQVIGSDGAHESAPRTASANVANGAPRLYTLALEAPNGVRVGQTLVATPDAQDPDGDRLTYHYQWRVNGESRGEDDPRFSLEGLRRGDEVVVVAYADDGEDQSEERSSETVAIGNGPPIIVSDARWQRSGNTFRYDVKAEDPDGDRTLRYRLTEAPSGMTIDSLQGRVSWTPRPDQAGKHRVEIEVDDLQGGKAVQSVTVNIEMVDDEEAGQAPAARAY
jgi:hypothetical protein